MAKPRGTTRRRLLGGGALAAAGAAMRIEVLPAQTPPPAPLATAPETLALVNGNIHTMNATRSVVTNVIMRNGKFLTVGGPAAKASRDIRVIDLKGKTVVPGLTEPHVHIVSLANRPGYHTPLENTASIREIQEVLAARRKDVPEGAWITSMGGWHPNQWTEHRHPTRAELDAAVPDRPVLLYERFTGPCVTNTLGKAFFDDADGLTGSSKPHPDYKPVNVSDTGAIAAVGFAGGGPSASALFLLRKLQTFADKKRSTVDAMNYAAQLGLTAHLDDVLFPTPGPLNPGQVLSNLDQYRMYDSWLELHKEGKTIVRLQMNFLQNQTDPALPELKERLRNQFQFFGDDMMQTGSIGEWAAPLGAGAVWKDAQRLVAQAGWRNENAVQNLAGLTQVVDEWEKLNKEFDITQKRWCVHHVPEVTPALLTRLKDMGCGVQMAGFRWVTSNHTAPPAPNALVGAQFRTIYNHGIPVGLHGDGVHIAPLNPWSHIQYATTGVNSFGIKVNGDQNIPRAEALHLFTRRNPWFLRMEDKIGSIEPGKLADLAVLDRDYFTVPDADIKKIRSTMTVVGGKVVYGG